MQHSLPYKVFLGWDANEMQAYNVAEASLYRHASRSELEVRRIGMGTLYPHYKRPTRYAANGQLFDDISGAPMSTGHAIARFFVPLLCKFEGWALFTDGDVLFREDVRKLFSLGYDKYAVQVVKHPPLPEEGFKKDGHVQQPYARKNWSSVVLFNCGHPSNMSLNADRLNTLPGRDLHAFSWLHDDEIGALPARWNYLNGQSEPQEDPALVHYTLGTPNITGREDPFSPEWWLTSKLAGYRQKEAVSISA